SLLEPLGLPLSGGTNLGVTGPTSSPRRRSTPPIQRALQLRLHLGPQVRGRHIVPGLVPVEPPPGEGGAVGCGQHASGPPRGGAARRRGDHPGRADHITALPFLLVSAFPYHADLTSLQYHGSPHNSGPRARPRAF